MPGCSVLTASAIVSASSMWMHFHGQMSTQPSHMMHSDWSIWRNCFGLTDLLSASTPISVRTYSPGNDGSGGLASFLAMGSGLPNQRTAVRRQELGRGRLPLVALLPPQPGVELAAKNHDVEASGDDVAQHLGRHDED